MAHTCCPCFKINSARPRALGWSGLCCGWGQGPTAWVSGRSVGMKDEGAGWWAQHGPGQAEREGNPLNAASGPVVAGGPCSKAG